MSFWLRLIPLGALLVVALFELGLAYWQRSAGPQKRDWAQFSAFLKPRFRDGDMFVVWPRWMDPLARQELGGLIAPKSFSWSTLREFSRVWVIQLPDYEHPPADETDPAFIDEAKNLSSSRVGRLAVDLWQLPPSQPQNELDVSQANVFLGNKACRKRRLRKRFGGLLSGPLPPAQPLYCSGERPPIWVGETIVEDLNLRPRRCIWVSSFRSDEPVRFEFSQVPPGSRLIVYGGGYYIDERERVGSEVTVLLGDARGPVRTHTHRDGEGWKRWETPWQGAEALSVTLRRTSRAGAPPQRYLSQGFCWRAWMEEAR